MAYRADIEIAVKGASQLTNLTKQLESASAVVNRINKELVAKGLFSGSIENLRSISAAADRTMRSATAGTYSQKQAIDIYVKSLANAEKAERNLAAAIKQRQRELGIRPTGIGTGRGIGGGRLGGVASNAIIGGAFPLLFGQGGGAATGGAIGGAVGGLFGGTGGFAGSLLGTLIGERAGRGTQIKELAADIGLTSEQTKMLGAAFEQAGADFDKFQNSVQNIRGLSLSVEDQADAIRLVSELTETYGGKIDKVTDAFTSALESGKVTQATLIQLTGQGIPIQEELARKYGVSRDALLQMAKDGKISVQTLADVLVDMGNKGLEAGQKPKSAFEQFSTALGNTATAVGNVAATLLNVLSPAIDTVILKATQALNILTETINTELLRTQIQTRSGKIVGPAKLKEIEAEAMSMAARRFPSQAKGRQLAAGPGIISPQAQAEFQIIREQLIRNELQRFGFESGILKAPKPTVSTGIGRITAPSQLPPSGKGNGGGADKAARDAAREAERVAEVVRQQQLATLEYKRQEEFGKKIAAAELARDPALVRRLQGEQQLAEWGIKTVNLLEKEENATARLAIARTQQAEKSLIFSKIQQDLAQIEADRVEKFQDIITGLERQNELDTIKDERVRALREIEFQILDYKKQGLIVSEAEAQLYHDMAAARIKGPGAKRMEELQTSISALTNTENLAIAAADNIGQAFGNAFQEIVTGASSGQEAIANMMKSIGENFVNMAAQIIAQQITMIILGTILKALGIGGGGGGGMGSMGEGGGFGSFSGGSFGVDSTGLGGGLSGAGALAPSSQFSYAGVAMRAAGGPVTAGAPYVIGERGPELFVPGTGGSVVSTGQLREAMAGGGMGGGAPVLNMSFETTRFGDTEYVSRDQLEAAMAATRRQAARDGAQRGMTMTLDKLQQSPQTRSRLGMR